MTNAGLRAEASAVAILGPFRSGTSCVGGVLHHLGVYMGRNFHSARKHCPMGTFEEIHLWGLCRAAYVPPSPTRLAPAAKIEGWLSQWLQIRRVECNGQSVGAKHPVLCAMIPELCVASPGIRLISVKRPLEDSIRSLQSCKWWGCAFEEYALIQEFLWSSREKALTSCEHLSLDYYELLSSPKQGLQSIADYLGLSPSDQQWRKASEFVTPALKHYG